MTKPEARPREWWIGGDCEWVVLDRAPTELELKHEGPFTHCREVTPHDTNRDERIRELEGYLKEILRWSAGFGDEHSIPHYWRDELLWRCHKEAKKAGIK